MKNKNPINAHTESGKHLNGSQKPAACPILTKQKKKLGLNISHANVGTYQMLELDVFLFQHEWNI